MIARVVPLVVVAAGSVYLTQAMALPFGSMERPGAGFYPVIVAAFTCIVGLVATVKGFLTSGGATVAVPGERMDAAARARVVASVVALVGFCLLMPWIGYPLSALAFVAIVLRRLGSRWWTALTIAVVGALGSYYLFAVLLDVPLPRGPW